MKRFFVFLSLLFLVSCNGTLTRYPSYVGDLSDVRKIDLRDILLIPDNGGDVLDLNLCKNLDGQGGTCYFLFSGHFAAFQSDYADCVEEFGGNFRPIDSYRLDLSGADPDGFISQIILIKIRPQDKDTNLREMYNFPGQNSKGVVIFDDEYRSRAQDYIDCKERQKARENARVSKG